MMIYLAHPYGGNMEQIRDAERIARGMSMVSDYPIFNPLEEFAHYGIAYSEQEILDFCKGALESCDLVIFAKGWRKSRGCRYEHFIAKMRGIPRIYLDAEDEAFFTAVGLGQMEVAA